MDCFRFYRSIQWIWKKAILLGAGAVLRPYAPSKEKEGNKKGDNFAPCETKNLVKVKMQVFKAPHLKRNPKKNFLSQFLSFHSTMIFSIGQNEWKSFAPNVYARLI